MSEPKKVMPLPDGSKVVIVDSDSLGPGEINEETIRAVKMILRQIPGAKIVGSVPSVI